MVPWIVREEQNAATVREYTKALELGNYMLAVRIYNANPDLATGLKAARADNYARPVAA